MSLILLSTSRKIPLVLRGQRILFSYTPRLLSSNQCNNDLLQAQKQQLKTEPSSPKQSPRLRRYHYYLLSIATGALIGTIYALRQVRKHEGSLPEYVANPEVLERKAMETRPLPPPVARRITFDAPPRKSFPFHLTLYQYVTCPFCCKVRAYLNYNRIPYDIVEVNSVMHTETKWSLYDRVPIVVVENECIQVNDSSQIVSAIESYLRQPTKTFKNIMKLYKTILEKDPKGRLFFTYPNKYLIVEPAVSDHLELVKTDERSVVSAEPKSFFAWLFSRSAPAMETKPEVVVAKKSSEDNEFERQWREWVDNKFIHALSPNIYCTLRQSLDTFRWFSKAGDWEEIFPWYQRWIIVYLGAIVMRAVSIRLKKKYNLHDDVRVSLYECADEWTNAIGEKEFLGGSEPNLADINVYGILTAIRGCEAFQDLLANTKIQPWFDRMQNLVESHRIDTPLYVYFVIYLRHVCYCAERDDCVIRTEKSTTKKIAVVGSGNCGSTIASHISEKVLELKDEYDQQILMWCKEEILDDGRKLIEVIDQKHKNTKYLPDKKLADNVVTVADLGQAVKDADVLIFVIPHQFMKKTCEELRNQIKPSVFAVTLIKGFYVDEKTNELLLVSEIIKNTSNIPCLSMMGANIAKEVADKVFCEARVGSRDDQHREIVRQLIDRPYFRIRFYPDEEIIEILGALKNVIAMCADFADGLEAGFNSRAALLRLGFREMIKFCRLHSEEYSRKRSDH